jgi:ABC-type transport system involved in cytochrome c biogenesis permease subunit
MMVRKTIFRNLAFSLIGVIVLILAAATVLDKIKGSGFAAHHIYSTLSFVLLWAVTAFFALIGLFFTKRSKGWNSLLLHCSFVVILTGAFITWLYAEQGTLHLRKGETTSAFLEKNSESKQFPFRIELSSFQVTYYNGTETPMDFISTITIYDAHREKKTVRVEMNGVGSYQGYRFYQSGYDDDGQGTILLVSHDPYGIAVTYIGYALLLLSFFLFFIDKQSHFCQLIAHPLLKRGTVVVILMFLSLAPSYADARPKTLPTELASRFCNLYVLYNGRICPLQTLAKDFTVKLYGSSSYRGYNAEQIFSGWVFYSDEWEDQPMIKIKSDYVRKLLGIAGKYASFRDFFNKENSYKLATIGAPFTAGGESPDRRSVMEADEKFNLIKQLYSGRLLKLFPYAQPENERLQWLAPSDPLPPSMNSRQWLFVRKSLDYLFETVISKEYAATTVLLDKMQKYQQKEAGKWLPSDTRFAAEKLYNAIGNMRWVAIVLIVVGLIAFWGSVRKLFEQEKSVDRESLLLSVLLSVAFAFVSFSILLRGYVSGHIPLANGIETMQFMSWSALLLTFWLKRRFPIGLSFGFLIGGLALMVSAIGESNPQITLLVPVLGSPLLCVHVVIIMISYVLLAFMMLNGITAFVLHGSHHDCTVSIERLYLIGRIMLYPAVFLLAIGIFVGAVWANISWGRYWGWDPKEVWALITFLIYSFALHADSLPWFRRPMFFHFFVVFAFLSVLITYFGVNFILGGMHSYAG